MKQYVNSVLKKLILAETSVQRLALSFSLGGFLAFSPYIGLQTWLTFPICWIFRLNVTVTLAALYLISNPFTMVPIIIVGYAFGTWLFTDLFHISIGQYNPSWLDSFVKFLAKHAINLEKLLGTKICFWCYFIGAHILAIAVALILYPLMINIFSKLIQQVEEEKKDENNYPK